ncbi:hypothetical protein QQF64_024054 [Cirrhinus molitorella]|uniref:Uncharacterized protein n=1 Tax=Cirrhinus molitorella TaxID=172907 RepID=A0ABR3NKS2_9TELE
MYKKGQTPPLIWEYQPQWTSRPSGGSRRRGALSDVISTSRRIARVCRRRISARKADETNKQTDDKCMRVRNVSCQFAIRLICVVNRTNCHVKTYEVSTNKIKIGSFKTTTISALTNAERALFALVDGLSNEDGGAMMILLSDTCGEYTIPVDAAMDISAEDLPSSFS